MWFEILMQPHFQVVGLSWAKPYVVLAGEKRRLALDLEEYDNVEKIDLQHWVKLRVSAVLSSVLSSSDFTKGDVQRGQPGLFLYMVLCAGDSNPIDF